MKKYCILLIIIIGAFQVNAQKLSTRTAHIAVESSNNIHDIEADNYQVVSTLNTKTGEVQFIALLKSFEFKVGAINRVLNSRQLDVTQYPKIKFEGEVTNIENIDFSKPGEHNIDVDGTLFIWDEKRVTSATGLLTVNEDGTISGSSDFNIKIEEMNVDKINNIMKDKLPAILAIDVDRLGISRDVNIEVDMLYK